MVNQYSSSQQVTWLENNLLVKNVWMDYVGFMCVNLESDFFFFEGKLENVKSTARKVK